MVYKVFYGTIFGIEEVERDTMGQIFEPWFARMCAQLPQTISQLLRSSPRYRLETVCLVQEWWNKGEF